MYRSEESLIKEARWLASQLAILLRSQEPDSMKKVSINLPATPEELDQANSRLSRIWLRVFGKSTTAWKGNVARDLEGPHGYFFVTLEGKVLCGIDRKPLGTSLVGSNRDWLEWLCIALNNELSRSMDP